VQKGDLMIEIEKDLFYRGLIQESGVIRIYWGKITAKERADERAV
jgi:hypothetical protein